jgi:hypothetical protein
LNNGHWAATVHVQIVADWVGIGASVKDERSGYALPPLDAPIATVALTLDVPLIAVAGTRWF